MSSAPPWKTETQPQQQQQQQHQQQQQQHAYRHPYAPPLDPQHQKSAPPQYFGVPSQFHDPYGSADNSSSLMMMSPPSSTGPDNKMLISTTSPPARPQPTSASQMDAVYGQQLQQQPMQQYAPRAGTSAPPPVRSAPWNAQLPPARPEPPAQQQPDLPFRLLLPQYWIDTLWRPGNDRMSAIDKVARETGARFEVITDHGFGRLDDRLIYVYGATTRIRELGVGGMLRALEMRSVETLFDSDGRMDLVCLISSDVWRHMERESVVAYLRQKFHCDVRRLSEVVANDQRVEIAAVLRGQSAAEVGATAGGISDFCTDLLMRGLITRDAITPPAAAAAAADIQHVEVSKSVETGGGAEWSTGESKAVLRLVIDTSFAGFIIGVQGRHKQQIEHESGAGLRISGKPIPPNTDRSVEIRGSPSAKAKALRALIEGYEDRCVERNDNRSFDIKMIVTKFVADYFSQTMNPSLAAVERKTGASLHIIRWDDDRIGEECRAVQVEGLSAQCKVDACLAVLRALEAAERELPTRRGRSPDMATRPQEEKPSTDEPQRRSAARRGTSPRPQGKRAEAGASSPPAPARRVFDERSRRSPVRSPSSRRGRAASRDAARGGGRRTTEHVDRKSEDAYRPKRQRLRSSDRHDATDLPRKELVGSRGRDTEGRRASSPKINLEKLTEMTSADVARLIFFSHAESAPVNKSLEKSLIAAASTYVDSTVFSCSTNFSTRISLGEDVRSTLDAFRAVSATVAYLTARLAASVRVVDGSRTRLDLEITGTPLSHSLALLMIAEIVLELQRLRSLSPRIDPEGAARLSVPSSSQGSNKTATPSTPSDKTNELKTNQPTVANESIEIEVMGDETKEINVAREQTGKEYLSEPESGGDDDELMSDEEGEDDAIEEHQAPSERSSRHDSPLEIGGAVNNANVPIDFSTLRTMLQRQ